MKREFLLTVLFVFMILTAFSQPINPTPEKTEAKIYLPAAVLGDSVALANEMPRLAGQLLQDLKQKGTKFYSKAYTYYLLTGEYQKAADAIDSVQVAKEDPTWENHFKIYALAKLKDKTEGQQFRKFFQQEFSTAFNKMSFTKKVNVAWLDTGTIKELNSGYKDMITGFKKSDSLSVEDAKNLSENYRDYIIFNKILPLVMPYTNDQRYKTSFPAIKGNTWGGVVPVEVIDEVADPDMKYKFVMELTGFAMKDQPDSVASKDINLAVRDVARTINLHVAAGIPKQNIDIVLAVHGKALNAFLDDKNYKKKYGINNPNIPLLKELQDFGVKIALCGQAMQYQGLEKSQFIPGVKVALTAQTVLSSYQLKGYVFQDLKLE
ncbi:MAG TPA: DsrE family protein [Ferruginibacter sp.]|jgi:intracellular sulfur oxidation DsrE/DsrF family protein|nr:DsrE family protein [Ferruginibacter sp.]